ncbi:MAG: hypothetical protein AMXMBFR84_29600 [Candidatus Hydrogenedentota bacterium]
MPSADTIRKPVNLAQVLQSEILAHVEKPSRYVGTELNATHKNPAEMDLRVAFVFPDLYDLGLGNLGIHILYAILNRLDWCWCERAYSPAPDMEKHLRDRGLPLFCNESKDELQAMDLIGFTLQSELTYTNILNVIDLAGMPLRTKDREDDAPLLFAGGPAVFNPEPLAPFIDFFVIGEGEDAVVEIAECLRTLRHAPRMAKLEAVAKIEGVYVPELYPMEVMPNGQILPKEDAPKIVKRLVNSLDGALFPTNYIVPYTQQVHDRLSLEVLRGCTQGCRFCQAGMVTRPVRERSLENIDKLMEDSLANTGYEEVSLVSLSTCDFSRPRKLVQQAVDRASKDRVSVSLPSLRLDSFSVEMADMVADVRRTGLTFAPEAASPRLRALINKWIPDEGLLGMAAEAYKRGWNHVKCYFMIGLPTERDEDVEAIVDLCIRTLKVGKEINPKAKVNLGVSTFVPKPFTPFQWAEQIMMTETERRQNILEHGFRKFTGAIKFGRHTPETTFIEGLVTRADRRGADLIEAAWRNGARFESWDEWCNLDAWLKAIDDINYDVAFEFRERDLNERLPWDHIDVMMPKEWFQEDWKRAMELKHAQDCRAGKCHLCGVIYRERELCKHMLKNQKQGRLDEIDWQPSPKREAGEKPGLQRLRFKIGREGEVKWLSHLELMNAWVRSLRRARAPIAYSNGFHAHPKITFASAPPVGEESVGDYMDVVLSDYAEPKALLARLKSVLAPGFRVFDVEDVPLHGPSLMSLCAGYSYTIYADAPVEPLRDRINEIMASDEQYVDRRLKTKNKKGQRRLTNRTTELNVRPMIHALSIRESSENQCVIDLEIRTVERRGIRLREVLQLLDLSDSTGVRVLKRATILASTAEESLALGV